MSKIQELKTELSLYTGWTKKEKIDKIVDVEIEDKDSETQKSASKTERWVNNCLKKVFGNDVFIFKMSSQEHPDFFIFNKCYESVLLEYNKFKRNEFGKIEYYKRTKLKGTPKLEKDELKKNKILSIINVLKIPAPVWVSVKHISGDNPYRVNKNPPELGSDVIYINFCGKNKTVWVTTANDIASRAGITTEDTNNFMMLMERHNEELRAIIPKSKFQLFEYLLGCGVAQKYMNVNSSTNDLERIFRNAKIKIDDVNPIIDDVSIIKPKPMIDLKTFGFEY